MLQKERCGAAPRSCTLATDRGVTLQRHPKPCTPYQLVTKPLYHPVTQMHLMHPPLITRSPGIRSSSPSWRQLPGGRTAAQPTHSTAGLPVFRHGIADESVF